MKKEKIFTHKMSKRLDNVIKKDKQINPEHIQDVIKSDFFYLINNYFEVEFDDIDVSINVDEKNKYSISVNSSGDRIKMIRVIPESN